MATLAAVGGSFPACGSQIVNGSHETVSTGNTTCSDLSQGGYYTLGDHYFAGNREDGSASSSVSLNGPAECHLDPQSCDGGGWVDPVTCSCQYSPIVIDMNRDGLALSSVATGVRFDIRPGGIVEQTAWTTPDSDDAFLVFDRNGNGLIDDGSELFGSFTPQPPGTGEPNGFEALAVFDSARAGGNGDGRVSDLDSGFGLLQLWFDVNHNGISEENELYSLQQKGVTDIGLRYREVRRRDEHGNQLRFWAPVSREVRPMVTWAIDVFFSTKP
jgi:hypothetical protein